MQERHQSAPRVVFAGMGLAFGERGSVTATQDPSRSGACVRRQQKRDIGRGKQRLKERPIDG